MVTNISAANVVYVEKETVIDYVNDEVVKLTIFAELSMKITNAPRHTRVAFPSPVYTYYGFTTRWLRRERPVY